MSVVAVLMRCLSDWMWITTAMVFAVTYLVASFYQRVSRYPRGPFPLPIFGNLLTLRKVRSLHSQANEWSKTYGDIFTLWMAHKPMVILNSHAVIYEALLDRKHQFSDRMPSKMCDIQKRGNHDIMFEDYTAHFKVLKRVAALAVRKLALSKSLEHLCTEVVDTCVDSLGQGQLLVDTKKMVFSMMYDLNGATMFGMRSDDGHEIRRLQEIDHEYYEASPDGLPSDIAPLLGLLYRGREKKIEALYTEFREIVYRLFTKAEDCYRPDRAETIVHALLAAREEAVREENGDAEYLTKGNMVQVVMNLFGGATDTSASALLWMLLRLAKHPTLQEKIQKEIEDNIGSSPPVYEDREKLPFTVACLLETVRCHPFAPLAMPHGARADSKIGTAAIPKGTGMLFNIYAVNHDPSLWDGSEEFRPDRFMDRATGNLRQDVGPLLSFSLGPRACPGEKLAHVDMFYIVVRLIQRLSFSAPEDTSGLNMNSIGSSIFLIPAQRNLVLKRRL